MCKLINTLVNTQSYNVTENSFIQCITIWYLKTYHFKYTYNLRYLYLSVLFFFCSCFIPAHYSFGTYVRTYILHMCFFLRLHHLKYMDHSYQLYLFILSTTTLFTGMVYQDRIKKLYAWGLHFIMIWTFAVYPDIRL